MLLAHDIYPAHQRLRTSCILQWAVVDIDADAPENADVKPELEPGEFIDVFLVPFEGLHKSLVVSLCQPNLLTGVLISVQAVSAACLQFKRCWGFACI